MKVLDDTYSCPICKNSDVEIDIITGLIYCDCCGAIIDGKGQESRIR